MSSYWAFSPTLVPAQGDTLVIPKPWGLINGDVIVVGSRSQGLVTAEPGLASGFSRTGAGTFPSGDRAQFLAVKPVPVASNETAASYTFTGLSPSSSRIVAVVGIRRGVDLTALLDGGIRYDIDAVLAASVAGGSPFSAIGLWGGEFTAGQSCIPNALPSGFALNANGQSSGGVIVANNDTTGSRTGLALLSQSYPTGVNVPSLTLGWPAAPTDPKSALWLTRDLVSAPPSPPAKFSTVSQFLATKGATALHRAPAGVAPSCLDTINKGVTAYFSVFEMSVAWTSANEPFLLGDRYLDPTALNVPAGTTLDPQAMTWAQISARSIIIGSNAPQPYVKLVDALAAVTDAGKGLALVDPKFGAGDTVKIAAMLDICDAHGGPSKIIIKYDSPITGTDLVVAAKARGYKTMNYWGIEIDKLTLAYNTDKWDIIGAKYDADTAMWNATKAIGKKTWAAIVPDQAALNTAAPFTGADLFMVQNLGVAAVGPSAPDPVTYAGKSTSEIEIAWLRSKSGISGLASLSDLRLAVYGTSERAYWAARSGLTVGSLADHKITAMRNSLGVTTGSLVEVARAFWTKDL